ncbi:unnamed protein product [Zymoseptoria tritici ST99CH_1E4]|uniref:Uncharacterized protein n=1 Tax=Zymoseptoria tritici ST99CH_1E4 TaxID=1276532 RepID=A0A2H1H903_ZYMTR|nr:unnamed protein product [Zymoseptoria tritici ST99CH_1E4]
MDGVLTSFILIPMTYSITKNPTSTHTLRISGEKNTQTPTVLWWSWLMLKFPFLPPNDSFADEEEAEDEDMQSIATDESANGSAEEDDEDSASIPIPPQVYVVSAITKDCDGAVTSIMPTPRILPTITPTASSTERNVTPTPQTAPPVQHPSATTLTSISPPSPRPQNSHQDHLAARAASLRMLDATEGSTRYNDSPDDEATAATAVSDRAGVFYVEAKLNRRYIKYIKACRF